MTHNTNATLLNLRSAGKRLFDAAFTCAAIAILIAMCGVALSGCATSGTKVEQYGVMREVMRDGHTEARVCLSKAVARPHAYAVGALEGLAGEITIVDGDVWVARVVDGDVKMSGPLPASQDQATLLTLTHVDKWESIPVTMEVEGDALESYIEQTARALGIDTSQPFPFVIEGDAIRADLHVINGYCPIATDPATMEAQPWEWSSPKAGPAVLVGFYAAESGGVMTHHGTSVHMHGVINIDGRTVAGHTDSAMVMPSAVLRLPISR